MTEVGRTRYDWRAVLRGRVRWRNIYHGPPLSSVGRLFRGGAFRQFDVILPTVRDEPAISHGSLRPIPVVSVLYAVISPASRLIGGITPTDRHRTSVAPRCCQGRADIKSPHVRRVTRNRHCQCDPLPSRKRCLSVVLSASQKVSGVVPFTLDGRKGASADVASLAQSATPICLCHATETTGLGQMIVTVQRHLSK